MTKKKLLASLLLVLAVLFMQVGSVAAAPQTQDTTITGTIQSITTETVNGTTTVLVTFTDGRTARVSVDTAVTLGLVTLDPNTQQPIVNQNQFGQPVSIDSTAVVPEPEEVNPISAILANAFGVEPSTIQGYHEDGFGFGVIAQALYMSQAISNNGDASLAGIILQAKRDHNFSTLSQYFDPNSTPTNWGQFKKALLEKKQNLGSAVSGHGNDENSPDQHGNGKDNNNGKGKGQDKKNNP